MITQTLSPQINEPDTLLRKDIQNNKQQLIIDEATLNKQSINNNQIDGLQNETVTQRDQDQIDQQIKQKQNKLEFTNQFNTLIQRISDKNGNAAEQFSSNFIKTSQYQLQNIIKSNNSSQIQQNIFVPSSYIPLASAKLKVDVQNKKRRTFVLKDIQFDKTNPSDRALQLSYRMAKERLNRQKQYINKNINTTTKPNKQLLASPNKSRLVSINSVPRTGATLSNPLKIPNREEFNEYDEFPGNIYSQTNKIQQNYVSKQIDAADLYQNEFNIRRRTINIGKIVKRNNITPINLSKSIDNTSRTIDIFSLRPSSNIPYNINNIQTDWNENALINPNSLAFRRKLQKQQRQRQLKILELSQRKNEKYHIRKFIISFLIEISDEAVQRIQQKRTFFSYRIHRYNKNPIHLMLPTELKEKSLQKSQAYKDLQNSQIGLGKSMIKLAESIHPKHERAKQNTLNIHSIKQILNKSRMNKEQVEGFMYESESNKDNKKAGKINKSRIQNVFAYTIEGKQQQQSNQNSNQESSSNQNESNSSEQESQSKENTSNHDSDSDDKDQESSDQSESQNNKSKDDNESDSSTSQQNSSQNTIKQEQKQENSKKTEQNQLQNKNKLKKQQEQKIQYKQDTRYPQIMNGSLQQSKDNKIKIPKSSINNVKYKTNKNLQKKSVTLNRGINMNKKSIKK